MRTLVQTHALTCTPTHAFLSGTNLKRKGERIKYVYVLEFLPVITQITLKFVKQEEKKINS